MIHDRKLIVKPVPILNKEVSGWTFIELGRGSHRCYQRWNSICRWIGFAIPSTTVYQVAYGNIGREKCWKSFAWSPVFIVKRTKRKVLERIIVFLGYL
jgi:hypothetical protein